MEGHVFFVHIFRRTVAKWLKDTNKLENTNKLKMHFDDIEPFFLSKGSAPMTIKHVCFHALSSKYFLAYLYDCDKIAFRKHVKTCSILNNANSVMLCKTKKIYWVSSWVRSFFFGNTVSECLIFAKVFSGKTVKKSIF